MAVFTFFLESSALLVFPDGSEFRIRENTSLDIKDVSQSAFNKTARRELKLNLGSMHYKVPPKKDQAAEFKGRPGVEIVHDLKVISQADDWLAAWNQVWHW